MTPNMPSSGRVDVRKAIHDALNVLAELDHSFDEFAALSEAHAAVAELIEADRGYDEAIAECDGSAESLDRHDAAHERRSLAIARLTGAAP